MKGRSPSTKTARSSPVRRKRGTAALVALAGTFHLYDGLKWWNGDKLVAQDFVNGIVRTLNPDTASEKGYYFYSVIQVKHAKGHIPFVKYLVTEDVATGL